MIQYESDRKFRIWGYTPGHNFLLLRSPLRFVDEDEYLLNLSYNIDIEFGGVAYLDLPDFLHGIKFKEIKEGVPQKFNKYSHSLGYKVFEIKSEEQVYYVVAGSFRIGKSNWLTESRVSNPDLKYDEILSES